MSKLQDPKQVIPLNTKVKIISTGTEYDNQFGVAMGWSLKWIDFTNYFVLLDNPTKTHGVLQFCASNLVPYDVS